MVSKTRMLELVKAFDTAAVDATLTESPALLAVRDERGRNWLHVCCGVDIKGDAKAAEASLATAKVLLRHGLPLDGAAFTEGAWQATPLWYTIGRGRNLALSRHYSQYLSLQLKARMEGIATPVYGMGPVHHTS